MRLCVQFFLQCRLENCEFRFCSVCVCFFNEHYCFWYLYITCFVFIPIFSKNFWTVVSHSALNDL